MSIAAPVAQHASPSTGTPEVSGHIFSPASFLSPSHTDDAAFSYVQGILIKLESASGLPKTDRFGSIDPFVQFSVGNQQRRSTVVKRNQNPVWNEQISFVVDSAEPLEVKVQLYDWEAISNNNLIGSATFTLRSDSSDWSEDLTLDGRGGNIRLHVTTKRIPHVSGFLPPSAARTHSAAHAISESHSPIDEYAELADLHLIEARRLHNTFSHGKCDPFVVISLGAEEYRSALCNNTVSPVWDESCPLWVSAAGKDRVLKLSVVDIDLLNRAMPLGVAYLPLGEIPRGKHLQLKLPLSAPSGAHTTDAELGEIIKSLHFDEKWVINDKSDSEKFSSPSQYGDLFFNVEIKERQTVEQDFWQGILDLYDTDHNGSLDEHELIHLNSTLKLGLDDAIIQHLVGEKGALDKNDLLKIFSDRKLVSGEKLKEIFRLVKYGKEAANKVMLRGAFESAASKSNLTRSKSNTGKEEKEIVEVADDDDVDNSGIKLMVQDRASGQIIRENVPSYIKAALALLYRTKGGRGLTKKILGTLTAMSRRQGTKMDNPKSVKDLRHFISVYRINTDEVEKPVAEYKNFNEFFYRKLKSGARKIAEPENSSIVVSPADCRMSVFNSLDEAKEFWVKGENFSIEKLLSHFDVDGKYAQKFLGGPFLIARLAPQDYHRFHYAVTGVPGKRCPIDGFLNTVNPIAVRDKVDVYTENKRVICPIETTDFGTVLAIAIGATMVGSIYFCKEDAGESVKKFSDHGYFAFGGSTVLYIFQPGSIQWDDDLFANSVKQLETLVKVGERIGKATGQFAK